MARRKKHWVKGHWRSAPSKKADAGSGWQLPALVVGAFVGAWYWGLGPFKR